MLRVVAIVCVLFAAVAARAAPADDAAPMAQKGADHFKKGQYLDAAQSFERAWQLDPADSKHLRYAGRAWQEVGHWFKARLLMERYLEIEKDAVLRASVQEKLEPLRKATPRQVAEALVGATEKYPHGKLEPEAAQALEDLGDERSLQRAAALLEVAKLGATGDSERDKVEAAARRVKARLVELQKLAEAHKAAPEPEIVAPKLDTPALEAPKPVVVVPAPPQAPAPAPMPALVATPHAPAPPASSWPKARGQAPWRTPVGWSCVGLGLVTAILGGVWLIDNADAAADYDAKIGQKDATGKVIGYGTDPEAPRRAQTAADDVNEGWIVGGALAGTGLALGTAGVMVLTGDSASAARASAVAPGHTLIVVSGRF